MDIHITRKPYNGSNSKVGDIVLHQGVSGIVIFRTATEFVVDYWEDKRLVVYPRNEQTELLMGSMEEVMEERLGTGGPAFPCHPEPIPQKDQDFAGMPLRDYLAAKAMPSCYAEYCAHANAQGYSEDWRMGVALDSYAMADAMLRARGAGQLENDSCVAAYLDALKHASTEEPESGRAAMPVRTPPED